MGKHIKHIARNHSWIYYVKSVINSSGCFAMIFYQLAGRENTMYIKPEIKQPKATPTTHFPLKLTGLLHSYVIE